MKYKFLTLSVIAALAGSTIVIAADNHDHAKNAHELNSELSLSEDNKVKDHGQNDGHGDHNEKTGGDSHSEHEEESGGVELSKAQLAAAGIVVEPLRMQTVANYISAPGEVLFNAYKSKKITPRISAQIIKRHKRLGQGVKEGQVLVSLSSVEMAQAQGDLIVADREWQRVKKLGKKVVSDRRYIESQIARQQDFSKVLAFGMTKPQVQLLLKSKDLSAAVGQFNLLATQNGTITHDDFIEGEMIEPGRILFEITDESSMWVEARLTPSAAIGIKTGTSAKIFVNDQRYSAKVTQIHHQLDEVTRTIAVRMEVENLNDSLHPGLFVEAQIQSLVSQEGLALPENAVLRSPDGDWAVFIEEKPGHFKAQEVEIITKAGDWVVIKGVEPNTPVVTKGAFFVQSEIAKSGFEVHNH